MKNPRRAIGQANNKELNLSAALYGRYVAGIDVEPFLVYDAGHTDPVAVGLRERKEIKINRARFGKMMSNIRDGNNGQKENWRYVYGWREVHGKKKIIFYNGAASDWLVRTTQEWTTAMSYVPTRKEKEALGFSWLALLSSFEKYLPTLVENNYAGIADRTLAATPQETGHPYTYRPETIIKLPCGRYTSTWHSGKELMRSICLLNKAFNEAIAAGKIKQTGGSSFSVT